jgi:tetratricopeptide (TPR) repeat protein
MIDDSNYASSELFLRQEVEFKLYSEEFKEFVQYIKSKDSILILISIPYNLDVPPRRVCESSITDDFKEAKTKIEALKQSGDYKSLLSLLNETIKNNPGNAELYFELGMALKNLGRKPEGITNIELSMAYDCDLWRGGEIYNTIARTIAAKEEIFYFDFSQLIKDQWGMNELFSDDFYPQNVYYEKAMENLGGLLKQQLKI